MMKISIAPLVLLVGSFLFLPFGGNAQDNSKVDSTENLTYASFLRWVRAYHPVARQADLIVDEADSKLLKARGGFDPKLYGNYDDKEYDQSNYWDIGDVGISIPTRLGIEIKGGYEWNDGTFLNPERNIPVQGQGALGISVPLGQGAFMDKRRADLAQAKIGQSLGAVDRTLLLNDLIMEAGVAYWNWSGVYELFRQFENAEERAFLRLTGIRRAFFQGDFPGVDTLDAYNTWQSFQVNRIQAEAEFQKASFELANYLWSENGLPVMLSPEAVPPVLVDSLSYSQGREIMLNDRIQNLDNHPVLLSKLYKIDFLNVERRLKAEALKPEVNLQYNLLTGKDAQFMNRTEAGTSLDLQPTENFKFGVELNFPIFLRKARGDIQVTKIKIQEERLSLDLKRQELKNKIAAQLLVVDAYKAQSRRQRQIVENSRQLLRLEEISLRAGESNLFLINQRELKLIENQQKLISLLQKYQLAELELLWISALLVDLS